MSSHCCIRRQCNILSCRDPRRGLNRLLSFANYPLNAQVKPIDLAEAGFVYTGFLDTVRCVWCQLELQNFSFGDVPIMKHYTECSWACRFLKGGDVGNVPIVADPVRGLNRMIQDIKICTELKFLSLSDDSGSD